jgi:hypothetical protein
MARGRSQAEEPDKTDASVSEDEQTRTGRVAPDEGGENLGASAAGTESPAKTEVPEDADPDNEKAESSTSSIFPAQYDAADEDVLPAQSRD